MVARVQFPEILPKLGSCEKYVQSILLPNGKLAQPSTEQTFQGVRPRQMCASKLVFLPIFDGLLPSLPLTIVFLCPVLLHPRATEQHRLSIVALPAPSRLWLARSRQEQRQPN